ncbi:hypothetical protein ACRAWF_06625 [Streptomyces sp. L7]
MKGPLITFHVDHWLRGGGTRTILVSNDPDFPENLTFTVGQHYIVAAEKDGSIPSAVRTGSRTRNGGSSATHSESSATA